MKQPIKLVTRTVSIHDTFIIGEDVLQVVLISKTVRCKFFCGHLFTTLDCLQNVERGLLRGSLLC